MSSQSPGTLAALLAPDMDVMLQLRWVSHLARKMGLNILIFHEVKQREDCVREIFLEQLPKSGITDIEQKTREIIDTTADLHAIPGKCDETADTEEMSSEGIYVRLKLVCYTSLSSLRRLLLKELGSKEIELLTQAGRDVFSMSDLDLINERRLFFRYIPCKMIICLGLEEGNTLSRILVATDSGPEGKPALQTGMSLASLNDEALTVLHINPDIGADAEQVGERRLERFLQKNQVTGHAAVNRRVVVDDDVHQSIRRVWEEGNHDLVVVGAPSQIEGSVGTKLGKGVAVAIVTNVSPFVNQFIELLENSIKQFIPQIEREDRIALVDRIQSSSAWNFDFITLMVLSTIMAAIGLIQNSAAVVIGAMLVAPLMTPLLGLGLALVQSNSVLARLSLHSIIMGVFVSLLGGCIVGLISFGFEEPTREMLSRGKPEILDILVAFAAGLAAAYASSRPGLIAALPGVAIAAALVPPIATAGLAFSIGDLSLAVSALLLFCINMVTIVLASMVSLWLVGLRTNKKVVRWTVVTVKSVIVLVLALGFYLTLMPKEFELTGKIPENLAVTVQESLGTKYELTNLAVAYDELGVQLNVLVAGQAPVTEDMANKVRNLISDLYDQPVRVRLLTDIKINKKTLN